MAVDQRDIIDIISIDEQRGGVVLTISDHLDWSNTSAHQEILQAKFNAYLAFVEGGQLVQQYPEAENRSVTFNVVFKNRPDGEGRKFPDRARAVIESAGFKLRYELFAESYNN